MDLSIITTYYNGSKYMHNYMRRVIDAINYSQKKVEIILVNDSPNDKIVVDMNYQKEVSVKIINNVKNYGIHKSRIIGLNKAIGDYVLFLDQDDIITKESIKSQFDCINNNYSVIVGNGYEETKEHKLMVLIKNNFFSNLVVKKRPYLKSRNFIISPGMCMIKRLDIPIEWKKNILNINGADDYYLWLLLFSKNCKFKYNSCFTYIHCYTGENVSNDNQNMYKSQNEMLSYLKGNLTKKDFITLKKTIDFTYNYKKRNTKYILKHPIIFIQKVYYSIVCNSIKTIEGDDGDISYLSIK